MLSTFQDCTRKRKNFLNPRPDNLLAVEGGGLNLKEGQTDGRCAIPKNCLLAYARVFFLLFPKFSLFALFANLH